MNMIEAVQSVLGNYANFSGRAKRSEFWWWMLAITIINFILSFLLIGSMDFDAMAAGEQSAFAMYTGFGGIILLLFSLAVLVPTLAVGARRLHDSNKSGWLQLIWILTFIPLLGLIALIAMIYLFVQKSDEGSNKYG